MNIVENFFKISKKIVFSTSELILRILAKGADELGRLLDEIWEAIRKWMNEVGGNKTKHIDDELIRKARLLKFKLKKLEKQFIGENYSDGFFKPSIVRYLDDVERFKFELVLKNGKLYDVNGKLYNTIGSRTMFSRETAIFVVDEYGRIFANVDHIAGKFHHSSFLAGESVAMAGEIKVIEGVIYSLSRKSGHYQPIERYMDQFVKMLQKEKVDISIIEILPGF